VDLVEQGLVDKEGAIMIVLPEHLDQLLHPRFPDVESSGYKDSVMTTGLPASPGAGVGCLAFTNEKVVENQENGIPSILVRDEVRYTCTILYTYYTFLLFVVVLVLQKIYYLWRQLFY
jgi:pyruvate,orthophosphate dikinase